MPEPFAPELQDARSLALLISVRLSSYPSSLHADMPKEMFSRPLGPPPSRPLPPPAVGEDYDALAGG